MRSGYSFTILLALSDLSCLFISRVESVQSPLSSLISSSASEFICSIVLFNTFSKVLRWEKVSSTPSISSSSYMSQCRIFVNGLTKLAITSSNSYFIGRLSGFSKSKNSDYFYYILVYSRLSIVSSITCVLTCGEYVNIDNYSYSYSNKLYFWSLLLFKSNFFSVSAIILINFCKKVRILASKSPNE